MYGAFRAVGGCQRHIKSQRFTTLISNARQLRAAYMREEQMQNCACVCVCLSVCARAHTRQREAVYVRVE